MPQLNVSGAGEWGLLVGGLLAFAYLLRMVPQWLSPHGAGVDHWYWKSYVEIYRRTGRLPPEMPQYLLEEAQWYPPVFPLLLARLPTVVFARWSTQIAILIDLARMALLLLVAGWQSSGTPNVVLIAGLVYATTPIQISYNIQLNPRGLGALLLDTLLVALLWTWLQLGPVWLWGLIAALGGTILLTHRMTTQLLVFVLLGTAVIYRRWELLLLLPAFFAVAVVFSRGFYLRVLRGHLDLISYWIRNWPWIGADPLRESPIYGDGHYKRPGRLHKPGVRGVVWHAFIMFGFNPAAWIACLLVYERLFAPSPLLIYPTPFLIWLLLPCLFAVATSLVPRLRCLGAGYLYVYNTSVLASLVLSLTFQFTRAPQLSTAFVGLALILNLAGVLLFYRHMYRNNRMRVDDELEAIIGELRRKPRGVVMCFPAHWYEVVTYKTGNPVLWGGHGYGVRKLEPTFPRLMLPVKTILSRYRVRYLLASDSALPESFKADLPPAEQIRLGEYRLYCFEAPTEEAAVANDGQEGAFEEPAAVRPEPVSDGPSRIA